MLSVEDALRMVEQVAQPLAPRRVALGETAGLILAEDVVSAVHSPPYHKALMDGYAVASSDRAPERTVLEEIGAGAVPRHAVTPGTATRLMTGAPLPEGADAIVAFEETEALGDDRVKLLQIDPSPGQHVLPMGASFKMGDVVLRFGAEIRPIEIGILAEIGHALVTVHPRPRVAVLPTGNELVEVGGKLAAGQIRNSNGPMLTAALARMGAEAAEVAIGRDERDELRRLIYEGLAADLLVICGGVSAGKFDLVPDVLRELGVEQVFHKVALRPGKPLWFGVKTLADRRALVFGLPGNPVSCFVCCELFVRPALAALAGRPFALAPTIAATLCHDYQYKGGRTSYLPARVTTSTQRAGPAAEAARATVEMLPWHGSADLATLTHANALVRLGTVAQRLPAGSVVDALCL